MVESDYKALVTIMYSYLFKIKLRVSNLENEYSQKEYQRLAKHIDDLLKIIDQNMGYPDESK